MTRIERVNAFRAEVAKVLADFPDGVGVSFALARSFALRGRTYAELAAMLGMTRENVRARIVRLIESLALRQHRGEAAGVRVAALHAVARRIALARRTVQRRRYGDDAIDV